MPAQVINTNKGTVEFKVSGAGIPILFCHGGHSSCREMLFHKGFDTRRFRLLTPSRPGYGKTPLSGLLAPRNTADLFIALLDELKLKKVIVVGISAGGLSALELASNFPDRVAKLVLISAVTKKWMSEADKTYRKAKWLFSPSLERYSWGIFRFLFKLFPSLMASTLFKELSCCRSARIANDEVTELHAMVKLQRSKEGFNNDLDQRIDDNVISKIICPTLILHSSNDNSVDIEHAKYAHSKIRNSLLNIYNNKWGHLIWLGQESAVAIQDTLRFIDNNH